MIYRRQKPVSNGTTANGDVVNLYDITSASVEKSYPTHSPRDTNGEFPRNSHDGKFTVYYVSEGNTARVWADGLTESDAHDLAASLVA